MSPVWVEAWHPDWAKTDCDSIGCPNDAAYLVTIGDAGDREKRVQGAMCAACCRQFCETRGRKAA